MSAIYNIDGFDAKKFSEFPSPTESELYGCIDKESLLDEETKSEIRDRRIFLSQQQEHKEGIVDYLIYLFAEKGPLEEAEKEALKYLNKLSEYYGNLVEKYGKSDPYFFGYLTPAEVEKLNKCLSDVTFEDDGEEEKELLQEVLNKALGKNMGIIYWLLP